MKTPKTPEHDIRCKGTKDDLELAREWIGCKFEYDPCTAWVDPECLVKRAQFCRQQRQAIEKELSKERLEFLVFKIETEERLEKLATDFGRFAPRSVKKPWYKRLNDFLLRDPEIILAVPFLLFALFAVALWFARYL